MPQGGWTETVDASEIDLPTIWAKVEELSRVKRWVGSKEQIKISVQFLNNELKSDSVKIIAHKRICENVDKCSNLVVEQKFIDTVKDNIIAVARSIKIEEAKKEKK